MMPYTSKKYPLTLTLTYAPCPSFYVKIYIVNEVLKTGLLDLGIIPVR